MKILKNGNATSPKGYKAAGVVAGIKKSGSLDVALLYSELPACPAGAFTENCFAAAPVLFCKKRLHEQSTVRGIIINSGNANSCTGKQGLVDAEKTAAYTENKLNLDNGEILVSSTGIIGVPLPMTKLYSGIDQAVASLADNGGGLAAQAIMTTDTVPKAIAVEIDIDGVPVKIGGIAKGAGMLAPRLEVPQKNATMLAYVTTDAIIDPDWFSSILKQSLNVSFNRISIDGDVSTNDTVIALANGAARNPCIRGGTNEGESFIRAFDYVMVEMAKMLVKDGEGATKFVELHVSGAETDKDAAKVAETVANSLLCKTAWYGADPNWGRILDAIGYSGIPLCLDKINLNYDDVPVVRGGIDAGSLTEDLVMVLKRPEFKIHIDLASGDGDAVFWTCDLTHDYVSVNAEYHT